MWKKFHVLIQTTYIYMQPTNLFLIGLMIQLDWKMKIQFWGGVDHN